MQEIIVFPDTLEFVAGFLSDELDARFPKQVHVGTEIPNPRTGYGVAVRRDGGPRLDVRREIVRLGVRVWAPTIGEASDLANLTRALIMATPGMDAIRNAAEIAGTSYVYDESQVPLLFFSIELTVVGTPLT